MQTAQTNSGHVAGGKTEADTSVHTATPVDYRKARVHFFIESAAEGFVEGTAEVLYVVRPDGTTSEQDAAFIARVCSAHADLVKAAKRALRYVEKELLPLQAKMLVLSPDAVKIYEESPVYQGLISQRDSIRATLTQAGAA